MAKLVGGKAIWSKQNCDVGSVKGAICSQRHAWEETEHCYVSPPGEYERTTEIEVPPANLDDHVEFCREKCINDGPHAYFNMYENQTKHWCNCLETANSPHGGFVDKDQCNKPTCSDNQVPEVDDCIQEDHYFRSLLYRTYHTSCEPFEHNTVDKFYYVWDYHGNYHYGSKVILKCLPGYQLNEDFGTVCCRKKVLRIHLKTLILMSFQVDPSVLLPELDLDEDTQTLECRFNDTTGGYWWPFAVPCEPLSCRYKPPNRSIDSKREIVYSPNTTTHQQYKTMVTYTCPRNQSMLPIIEDEWSFDYSDSAGIIQELNATCTLDGTWQIDGGVIGETCPGTAGNPIEDCDQPKIPKCVDKNKYCTDPPTIPKFANRNDINIAAPGYKIHPGTVFYYYCPLSNWAFDYSYDESLPSYIFTNNVNNMTITCDPEG